MGNDEDKQKIIDSMVDAILNAKLAKESTKSGSITTPKIKGIKENKVNYENNVYDLVHFRLLKKNRKK